MHLGTGELLSFFEGVFSMFMGNDEFTDEFTDEFPMSSDVFTDEFR